MDDVVDVMNILYVLNENDAIAFVCGCQQLCVCVCLYSMLTYLFYSYTSILSLDLRVCMCIYVVDDRYNMNVLLCA